MGTDLPVFSAKLIFLSPELVDPRIEQAQRGHTKDTALLKRNAPMFKLAIIRFSVVAVFSLGICQASFAQLYSAPTVSNYLNLYQTPTINSYQTTLSTQRLNAGYGNRSANIYSPSASASSGSRIGLGLGTSSRASKPFSGISSAPTVSPYLNLFRTDLNGGSNFNYSTLVQPQLQQQQVNQQLERQTIQNNRKLTAIAAQADFNPQGSKDEFPTGHQTVFNYWGHYFPAAQVRPKRTPGR